MSVLELKKKKKNHVKHFITSSCLLLIEMNGFGRTGNVSNTKLQSLHREKEDTIVQAFRQ